MATVVALVALVATTSCTSDVDDYFDSSASQRIKQSLDETRQVLRSAEYGWEFEYYPGYELEYGGVVYTVRFDSLTATVGCSLLPDSVATSYYRLSTDNGPVLTFDTFNPLIHYFATPSSSEYEAKGGDFEFVIDSVATDFIRLYGKKTHNTMYMRRLNASPEEYAQHTVDIYDHFVDSIHGTIGTAELTAAVDPVSRSLACISGRDTFELHYTYYNEGIRLYQPLHIGGLSVQSFRYDIDTNAFSCADEGAEDVQLQGVPYAADRMNFSLWEGDYTLRYDNNTASVHLKANRLEGNYLLQGLSPSYDLVMHYDKETGNLTLGSQIIGEQAGRTIYWVCYDYNEGNLSLDDEGQFTISWNGNRFYPVFNFHTTNPNVLNCDGGLLIYLYYDEEGQLSAAIVDDESWMTNGSQQFRSLTSLNRRTRL